MPAITLDPRTALVVLDLQKGIATYPTVHPFADVLANAVRLAEAFRRAELPVVLVNVVGSPDGGDGFRTRAPMRFALPKNPAFGELVPELGAHPGDIRITKRQPNAFFGTELDLQLRRRQITQVVLAGVESSVSVDSTARAAHELAYNVTFVSDAITDTDPAGHDFAMRKTFPWLGETGTTDAVLALLKRE